jgi:hypothetical protein
MHLTRNSCEISCRWSKKRAAHPMNNYPTQRKAAITSTSRSHPNSFSSFLLTATMLTVALLALGSFVRSLFTSHFINDVPMDSDAWPGNRPTARTMLLHLHPTTSIAQVWPRRVDTGDDGWDCESQIDISISIPGGGENRARCFCAEMAIARQCCSD